MSEANDLFSSPKRLPFAEYVAAALIEIARMNGDIGIARPIEDLPALLQSRFDGTFHADEIADAVEILRECDTAFVARDPLAGTFVSISEARFERFLEGVSQDKVNYYKAINAAGMDGNSMFYAEEETPTQLWDVLRIHKVIERYSEFGTPFIEAAMTRLGTQDLQDRLATGSDRIVSFADNLPVVEEIRQGLQHLKNEFKRNNELGDLMGDSRDEAVAELEILSATMAGSQSRAGYLLDLSKKTLGWIGRITAKTSIEDLVKRLIHLFVGWLT